MTGTEKMARGRPKTSDREDVTVRLDRTIARRAKAVADWRGISLAELLSELARAPVDRAFADMVRQMPKPKGEA